MPRPLLLLFCALTLLHAQGVEYIKSHYTKYDHEIAMRDGVHIFPELHRQGLVQAIFRAQVLHEGLVGIAGLSRHHGGGIHHEPRSVEGDHGSTTCLVGRPMAAIILRQMDRRRLIAVARGDAEPDLVIEGARVFCTFTREWLDGDGYPFWPFFENVRSWWGVRDLPNVLTLHFALLKRDLAPSKRPAFRPSSSIAASTT